MKANSLGMAVNHNSPYLLEKAGGNYIDAETGKRLGFDHRFMGNGEGAQVHGWGSYFSVNDLRNYGGRESTKVFYDGDLLEKKISALAFNELAKHNMNIADALDSLIRSNESIKKSMLPNDRKQELISYNDHTISEIEKLDQSKFEFDSNRHHYTVEIPDNDGTNYIEESKLPTEEQMSRIYAGLKAHRVPQEYIDSLKKGLRWKVNRTGRYVYQRIADIILPTVNNYKEASAFLHDIGFVGIHYFGERDGECYVIFDDSDAKIIDHSLYGLDCADGLGRVRTESAPRRTITAYKLMRLVDGKLYPLYIDRSEPVELGVWYNADSVSKLTLDGLPFGYHLIDLETEQVIDSRQKKPTIAEVKAAAANGQRWFYIVQQKTKIGYKNVGIAESNGEETVKADFALRPGWHCGSLPVMNQIGKGPNRNLRDDSFVWTEIEISADVDYNDEAKANGGELYYIPHSGYYEKCTNANKTAAQADKMSWYIAGAIKINRIISDSEARQIIDRYNREHRTNIKYDYPRESGKMFNADTMSLQGLNGANDFYALFSTDNDLLVDFGRGLNLRDVKKKATAYMQEHNIQSAFIKITDFDGDIKDTIDIDLGLQGTKKAPKKQTDSWYIDKLRHKFFMQLVTKARAKVEVAQELSLMAVDAMVEFGQWKNHQYESPENTTDRLKAHEILCRITDKLLDKRIIAKADAALAIGNMIRDCLLDFAKWKDKQHDKCLQGTKKAGTNPANLRLHNAEPSVETLFGRKSSLLGSSNNTFSQIDIDEAKVEKNTQSAKNNLKKYRNGDYKPFDISLKKLKIESLGRVLLWLRRLFKMIYHGQSSYNYYITPKGLLNFRISNHNANPKNFKANNADFNISVYVALFEHKYPDADVEYTEYRYSKEDYEAHAEKIIEAIINGFDHALETGEFVDCSGYAKVLEHKKAGQPSDQSGTQGLGYNDWDGPEVGDWFSDKYNNRYFRIDKVLNATNHSPLSYKVWEYNADDSFSAIGTKTYDDVKNCTLIDAPQWYTDGKANNYRLAVEYFKQHTSEDAIEDWLSAPAWTENGTDDRYIMGISLSRHEVVTAYQEAQKELAEKEKQPEADYYKPTKYLRSDYVIYQNSVWCVVEDRKGKVTIGRKYYPDSDKYMYEDVDASQLEPAYKGIPKFKIDDIVKMPDGKIAHIEHIFIRKDRFVYGVWVQDENGYQQNHYYDYEENQLTFVERPNADDKAKRIRIAKAKAKAALALLELMNIDRKAYTIKDFYQIAIDYINELAETDEYKDKRLRAEIKDGRVFVSGKRGSATKQLGHFYMYPTAKDSVVYQEHGCDYSHMWQTNKAGGGSALNSKKDDVEKEIKHCIDDILKYNYDERYN